MRKEKIKYFNKLNTKFREAELRYEEYLEHVNTGNVIRCSWGQPDSVIHASGAVDGEQDRIVVILIFGSKNEIGESDYGYMKFEKQKG